MASCSSFAEGGMEDSCSICLDGFCYTNPITDCSAGACERNWSAYSLIHTKIRNRLSTTQLERLVYCRANLRLVRNFSNLTGPRQVTTCKHGYHLQCILEWAQRSKDCPMCWQSIGFEDPNSQELLHAVEQERCIRRRQQSPPRFQHMPLGNLEFDHVPGDSDFEDSIVQQLASVAMGRARLMPRRRDRIPTSDEHLQYVIVPSPISSMGGNPSSPHLAESSSDQITTSVYTPMGEMGGPVTFSFRDGVERMEHASQHGAESYDLQSFSGTLKSRITAVSSRYKESFAKTTRGFRERLWGRNNNIPDCGARAREMSAGVVRALEQISLESPSSASDRSDYESNGGSSRRSSHRVVPQPLHGQTCN